MFLLCWLVIYDLHFIYFYVLFQLGTPFGHKKENAKGRSFSLD